MELRNSSLCHHFVRSMTMTKQKQLEITSLQSRLYNNTKKESEKYQTLIVSIRCQLRSVDGHSHARRRHIIYSTEERTKQRTSRF